MMTNDELNKFILRYVENDRTHRALMLSGGWGTGKSYYVNHFLVPFLESRICPATNKPYKCIVVSLYGLNSPEEISRDIFLMRYFGNHKRPDKPVGNAVRLAARTIMKGLSMTYKIPLPELPSFLAALDPSVNGTISSVEKDYLTLNTGKKSYIIHTDKNTKYTGDKPAKGYKTEITYTGNLSKNAKAANVYCVKTSPEKTVIFKVTFTDGVGNILSTQTVEKGKAAKAPADPKREGYTYKGWDKKFDKVTSDLTVSAVWEKNEEPAPEPEPEPEKEFTVEGVITLWPSGDDDAFNVMLDDGSELTLTAGDYTEIASGYFPEEEDKVKVVYTDPSMKATKIELLERVVPEEQGKDDQGGEAAPEEKSEEPAPEEQPAEPEPAPAEEAAEPEPAPAEEAAEPEPEPAAEPELAAEPEPEPKEEPDIVVSAKGTIIEGNEKKRTVKIKTEDGEEIELSIDDKCDISSGFFPQKDDVVEIKYMKKAMVLKAVKLIDRPAQDAADAQSE